MNRLKVVGVMLCAAIIALTFSVSVKAQGNVDKKTIVTFSQPVEVPGVNAQVLPAGTYVFKLVGSIGDYRHVVRILSKDEKHIYTTILAIPNLRLKSTEKTVMTFGERGAGQPEAIKAWFSPGDTWGHEFVYPKKRALELARTINEPILAIPIEVRPDTQLEALKEVPIVAVKPTGEEVALTEVVEAPPAQAETEPIYTASASLPHTASSLPMFGLIGLVSVCASFAILIVTKRIA